MKMNWRQGLWNVNRNEEEEAEDRAMGEQTWMDDRRQG